MCCGVHCHGQGADGEFTKHFDIFKSAEEQNWISFDDDADSGDWAVEAKGKGSSDSILDISCKCRIVGILYQVNPFSGGFAAPAACLA